MSENRRGDFFDSRCRVTSVESPATTSAELCQFHCTSLLSVCRNDHSAGTALLEILDCMHGYLRQTTKKVAVLVVSICLWRLTLIQGMLLDRLETEFGVTGFPLAWLQSYLHMTELNSSRWCHACHCHQTRCWRTSGTRTSAVCRLLHLTMVGSKHHRIVRANFVHGAKYHQ